ncbi:MAG: peptidylprolyl isomerase [bacterium]
MKFLSVMLFVLLIALPILSFAQGQQIPGAPIKKDSLQVVFKTTLGDFTILLFEKEAPVTVKNFLAYADSGYYNGTIFHRVISGFMAQGGGFDRSLKRRPTFPPIINESNNGLSNQRGTAAMARTPDPNSATSQFFINYGNNARLDYSPGQAGYAVFGKVLQGMDVIDKMAAVPTESKESFRDVPSVPIIVISASRK